MCTHKYDIINDNTQLDTGVVWVLSEDLPETVTIPASSGQGHIAFNIKIKENKKKWRWMFLQKGFQWFQLVDCLLFDSWYDISFWAFVDVNFRLIMRTTLMFLQWLWAFLLNWGIMQQVLLFYWGN